MVILSERTAKRFWPNQNPMGQHVTLTMMTKEPAEMVGVVREVKTGALDASEADAETAVYAPAAQFAFNGSTLVVRTVVRAGAHRVGRSAPCGQSMPNSPCSTQDDGDVVDESLGQRPLAMLLFTAFAVLALALASHRDLQRARLHRGSTRAQIGIRMALGAPSTGVLRLIMIEGLKPTLAGVVLGLVLAAALVRCDVGAALRRQPARSLDLRDRCHGCAGCRSDRDIRAGLPCDARDPIATLRAD